MRVKQVKLLGLITHLQITQILLARLLNCAFIEHITTIPLSANQFPNSTGEVTVFNGEIFKPGIQVSIVHRVEAAGTFHYSTPNRIESITFNYTTN